MRDVARTLTAAAEAGRCGERYLVGGVWISIPELVEVARALVGLRASSRVMPTALGRAAAPFASLWARLARSQPRYSSASLDALRQHRLVIDTRAIDELGHRPRPLEQTLADTHGWFVDHGMLARPRRPIGKPALSIG